MRTSTATGILAAAALALALSGCSERMLDTGLTQAVFGPALPPDAPSPVRPMTGEVTEYPNLGTVPPRPDDLRTPDERAADMKALEQDRAANRSAADTLRGLPDPRPVPAPPDLRPGSR